MQRVEAPPCRQCGGTDIVVVVTIRPVGDTAGMRVYRCEKCESTTCVDWQPEPASRLVS